eukprot:1247310-Heterocapsa_arctica.AAC.1
MLWALRTGSPLGALWCTSFVGPAHGFDRGDRWGTSGGTQGPAGGRIRRRRERRSGRRCETPLTLRCEQLLGNYYDYYYYDYYY